eukprot:TRINITY_DN7265_c0_g1_i1.p1 TRINITY_DN7265_c0_g1~~TRINITY_DN7265_c0_g1_i1.p1  ORF type:complete len:138 (-),score=39.72 TRINITY_DN7265_c0_g1_i1:387-800(-)
MEQAKFQEEVQKMVKGLQEKFLFPIQRHAFQDCDKCFDIPKVNEEKLSMCIDSVMEKPQIAQQVVNKEFEQFQHRITAKMQECVEIYKDDDANGVQDASDKFESCVDNVYKKNRGLIDNLEKRIAKQLSGFMSTDKQ